jgi:hypothetical protein
VIDAHFKCTFIGADFSVVPDTLLGLPFNLNTSLDGHA